ncbi:MAG: hypothetical protein AB1352_02325 [Patescibacteria group bacterium]
MKKELKVLLIILICVAVILLVYVFRREILNNENSDAIRLNTLRNNDFCADSQWQGEFKSNCKPQDKIFEGMCSLGMIQVTPKEEVSLKEIEAVLAKYNLSVYKDSSGKPFSGGYGAYKVIVPDCSEVYWQKTLLSEEQDSIERTTFTIQYFAHPANETGWYE